jgi:hypothetical protein
MSASVGTPGVHKPFGIKNVLVLVSNLSSVFLPVGPSTSITTRPDTRPNAIATFAFGYRVHQSIAVGPRWCRLGARAVGYTLADLDNFINAGQRRSTSDVVPSAARRSGKP